MVAIYGRGELAALATKLAMAKDRPTINIDADNLTLPRSPLYTGPLNVNRSRHMKVDADNSLLGAWTMEHMHRQNCNTLKMVICMEHSQNTAHTLQRMCQPQIFRLACTNTYPYHATGTQQRDIHYALQVKPDDVCDMLNLVASTNITSRVTCISMREGTEILEKLARMDHDGFLVVIV